MRRHSVQQSRSEETVCTLSRLRELMEESTQRHEYPCMTLIEWVLVTRLKNIYLRIKWMAYLIGQAIIKISWFI